LTDEHGMRKSESDRGMNHMDEFNVQEELKKLPDKPGVYIMEDRRGEAIYVGKAASLKNRVRHYFQPSAGHSAKTRALTANIRKIQYIATDSELEALILECDLIKKHKPKYNVLLKDDKTYPYIKVSMNEEYPRIFLTRRMENDGAQYFGPYPSAFAARETIGLIKKLFPVKTCKKALPRDAGKGRPCLNYHIYQCLAPCRGNVDKEEYRALMKDVCAFLEGKYDGIAKELEKKMKEAAENMEFEKAASLRDKISSLKLVLEKHKMETELNNALIEMEQFEESTDADKKVAEEALLSLARILASECPPSRIEAYDISNTGSDDIVASMVVFQDGIPLGKEYRKFKIKSVNAQDDYGAMQEVLYRRLKRAFPKDDSISEKPNEAAFQKLPDLMLVDGGVGHVNAAREVLKRLDADIPVLGMAKDEKHRTRYLVGTDFKLDLYVDMPLLKFISSIQDEAHRFALEYNKKLRKKRYSASALDEIKGIGPARKKALIKHFGSIEMIKRAGIDELMAVESMNRSTAEKVYKYFRS